MSAFDELSQEIVMDHYRSPRNTARLDHIPQAQAHENPTCGDSLKPEVVVGTDDRLERVRFDAKGCAISAASASLMTESARGLSVAEARAFADTFIGALRDPRLACPAIIAAQNVTPRFTRPLPDCARARCSPSSTSPARFTPSRKASRC